MIPPPSLIKRFSYLKTETIIYVYVVVGWEPRSPASSRAYFAGSRASDPAKVESSPEDFVRKAPLPSVDMVDMVVSMRRNRKPLR